MRWKQIDITEWNTTSITVWVLLKRVRYTCNSERRSFAAVSHTGIFPRPCNLANVDGCTVETFVELFHYFACKRQAPDLAPWHFFLEREKCYCAWRHFGKQQSLNKPRRSRNLQFKVSVLCSEVVKINGIPFVEEDITSAIRWIEKVQFRVIVSNIYKLQVHSARFCEMNIKDRL